MRQRKKDAMGKDVRGHQRGSPSPSGWALVLVLMLLLSLVLVLALRPSCSSSTSCSGGAALSVRFPANSISQHTIRLNNYEEELLGKPWVETISWKPRAFIYHNFLSKEECEHLISLAKPHMVKSTVIDRVTGKTKDSSERTSSGTFLSRGQDKIIRTIEKRIADSTFLPEENGEGLQILHYEVGQKYDPHYDYFRDPFTARKNGGQRVATMLMYLSDVEAGGETIFPSANMNSTLISNREGLSECASSGLPVRPSQGDALLFWNMRPDASLDSSSLHGGCPVISGNKWVGTKWMHVREYRV